MGQEIICAFCGKSFIREPIKGSKRKYCSLTCQRAATKNNNNKQHKAKLSEYSHKGYMSKAIISLYEGRCAICKWRATEELITISKGTQYAYGNEIHHILQVNKGGKSDYSNLILLCPNHHKQADMGILSQEELKTYLKKPPTQEQKQVMSNNAVDHITAAIFNT